MNRSSILLRLILILIIDENISDDSWGIKLCVFRTDKVLSLKDLLQLRGKFLSEKSAFPEINRRFL